MTGNALVVCIGSDGHVAVEWATSAGCSDRFGPLERVATPTSPVAPSAIQPASVASCSDACTDLFLVGVVNSDSDASLLASAATGSSWEPGTSGAPLTRLVGRYGLRGPNPSHQTLSSLRTVSIRC